MKYVVFISNTAILLFLLLVIIIGIFDRKNILELFIKGSKDGVKVIWNIFPSLLALIVAVGMFRSSGITDYIGKIIYPILNIDKELIPMILLRPISSSSTIAIATDIMKNNGPDSKIGLIASTIMGATETTIYVVALYCSKLKIKNVREPILIGLLADLIGITTVLVLYR